MPEFESKPSKQEDEYFAREDVEKKRKLAFAQHQTLAGQEREALKKLHHMKCPSCGLDLHAVRHSSVEVDTCFNCHGVFLREGQLEKLLKAEHQPSGSVMQTVLTLFKKEMGP